MKSVYSAVRAESLNTHNCSQSVSLTFQQLHGTSETSNPLHSPSSARCSLVPVRPSRYPALQSAPTSSEAPQSRPQSCPPAPRGTLHTVPSPHRLPPRAMSHPAPTSGRTTSNRNCDDDDNDDDNIITSCRARNVSFIMSPNTVAEKVRPGGYRLL